MKNSAENPGFLRFSWRFPRGYGTKRERPASMLATSRTGLTTADLGRIEMAMTHFNRQGRFPASITFIQGGRP